MDRAVSQLGACGIQIFTNVGGKPLDAPEFLVADVKTKKGEIVWTGYEPAGELQYGSPRTVPVHPGMAWDSIRILGHQDAAYDYRQFDLDRDLELSDKSGIEAHTYDLSPFKSHGGKLPMYHGWADPANPARQHRELLHRRTREDG